jgi:hypothetical protein
MVCVLPVLFLFSPCHRRSTKTKFTPGAMVLVVASLAKKKQQPNSLLTLAASGPGSHQRLSQTQVDSVYLRRSVDGINSACRFCHLTLHLHMRRV